MIARLQEKYLVAMPTKADIHIQNIAPGPPILIAMATPLIFPKPTVAAIAAESACLEDIWPGTLVSSYFPLTTLMACPKCLKGKNPE
jgi:hypothetical protein